MLKQILQLKYLQSSTRWRIVQDLIARWQCLLPGLRSNYQTTLAAINKVALQRERLVPRWAVLERVNYLGAEPARQVNSAWPSLCE